jgi:hypothetical protein
MFLSNSLTEVIPAAIFLLSIAFVGGVIILTVRKKLKAPPTDQIAYTLGELKEMHSAGKISLEEYERAKQSIIDSATKQTTDSQQCNAK